MIAPTSKPGSSKSLAGVATDVAALPGLPRGLRPQMQRPPPKEDVPLLAVLEGDSPLFRQGWRRKTLEMVRGNVLATSSVRPKKGTVPSGTKVTRRFVYDASVHAPLVDNLRLKGSFRRQGDVYVHDPKWGGEPPTLIPMRSLGNGRYEVEITFQSDGHRHAWEWGVVADTHVGKDHWMVMSDENPRFDLDGTATTLRYAPVAYPERGATKDGDDLRLGIWLPAAAKVTARIFGADGQGERVPLENAGDGQWQARLTGGWSRLLGKAYVYEIETPDGRLLTRPDPHAVALQGEQRGIGRIQLDPKTGDETHEYAAGGHIELMRFEINQPTLGAERATLILRDQSGRQLDRAALQARLGTFDGVLIDTLRRGQFRDFWGDTVAADGTIAMTSVGGAFSTLVHNPTALEGLSYELQLWKDGRWDPLESTCRHASLSIL